MKKRIIFVCFLSIGIAGIVEGCSHDTTQTKSENEAEIEISLEETEESKNEKKSDFSKGDLFTMFEEVNNETVLEFFYDDYNQDGIHEAFVLTKEENYKLWYMSAEGCEIVGENLIDIDEAHSGILAFYTKDYLLLQQSGEGGKNTIVYSIDNDNRVIEPNVSQNGYLYQNKGGEILLQAATGLTDMQERPSCNYYLYYSPDAGFKEYGAIPIIEEQFLEFEGAQEILDGLYEMYPDYEMECSFLYRSNHYINVNISLRKDDKQQNKHMTLKYDMYGVKCVSKELENGRIEIAYMLEIATFPTAFRHPNKRIAE